MRERATPLGARILVKPLEGPDMTAGGVVLPDEVRQRAGRGMIVAAGPGYVFFDGSDHERTYGQLEVQVGDVILWDEHDGMAVTVQGEELVLLCEHHVQAVLEDADKPSRFVSPASDAGHHSR